MPKCEDCRYCKDTVYIRDNGEIIKYDHVCGEFKEREERE